LYPRIIINTEKFRHNLNEVRHLASRHGLSMMAVSKSFCAVKPLIDVLKEERIDFIADSRLKNLESFSTTIPKVLLRLVSKYEADRAVNVANISLNSEIDTIRALNEAAGKYNLVHGVVLMVDIGDLREGVYYKEDLIDYVKEILEMKHVKLEGLGTNLTCYGGIIPTKNTLQKLVDITSLIEEKFDIELNIISGGNSSHLHLLDKDIHIDKVNNLRIGEAIVLGRETAYGEIIETLYDDVFTLETDIIEYKKKPSLPEGDIGMDAFGKKPEFEDLGVVNRAILAVGKQDVDFRELKSLDKNITLLGSSSDHIIAGIWNHPENYKVGDVIRFKLTYGSLLSLMTSDFVEKVYVKSL